MSLDTAIAEFLESCASGQPVDRKAFLARYPAITGELESFFADHDRMQRLAAPFRPSSENLTLDGQNVDDNLAVPDQMRVERIGKYLIECELGRGGMGVVYKALDGELQRTVALKMVSAGRFAAADDLERFRGEARLAASLAHPGIVPIFEAGEWQGLPFFFAMGLVEGFSLADLIRNGPLPPRSAARLLKKVAEAVAFAHARGVVHRDLKPANILLSGAESSETRPRGHAASEVDSLQPAITDFGLAKRLDVDHQLTVSGQVLGTPAYMSPEQATGNRREIVEASDTYSLGAILYAMITGRPPFVADRPIEVILKLLECYPELPQRLNPAVTAEISAICLKCLEKRPEQRYLSVDLLVADLERYLRHEPLEAGRGSLLHRLHRWARREPVAAWHLGVLAFILLLAQTFFALHLPRDWNYHLLVCSPLIGWLVGCVLLQSLLLPSTDHSVRLRDRAHYFWSGMDVLFLTVSLKLVSTPIALLMSCYLILICGSSLFFQTRLVAFTTILCIIGSSILLAWTPAARAPLHTAFTFEAALAIAGLLVGYQLWRFRVLRDYYEAPGPRR